MHFQAILPAGKNHIDKYARLQIALSLIILLCFCVPLRAQPDSVLMNAISNCDKAKLQNRLKENVDINATDASGANAFMWAVFYCDVPMIKELVARGATAPKAPLITDEVSRSYYGNPQVIAASKGKLQVLKYLVDSLKLLASEFEYNPGTGRLDGWTPLSYAARDGQLPVIKYLLSKNVRVDALDDEYHPTAFLKAASNGHWEICKLLLQAGKGEVFGARSAEILDAVERLATAKKRNAIYEKKLVIEMNAAFKYKTDFSYAVALAEAGKLFYEQEDYYNAEKMYQKAFRIFDVDTMHRFMMPNYLNDLALVYERMHESQKALMYFKKALKLRDKSDDRSADYVTVMNNVAYLKLNFGDYYRAGEDYKKAFSICSAVNFADDSTFSETLNYLGLYYTRIEVFDSALMYLIQARDLREKRFGKTSGLYLNSLDNLATLYKKTGEKEKALQAYKEVVNIRRQLSPRENADYATSLSNLAGFYADIGDSRNALALYRKSLAIRKKVFEPQNTISISNYKGMGLVHSNNGWYSKAAKYLLTANRRELNFLSKSYDALSEEEQMVFLDQELSDFSFLPSILLNGKKQKGSIVKQVYANEVAIKGVARQSREDISRKFRNNPDTTAQEKYLKFCSNKRFLAQQALKPLQQRGWYYDSVMRETNELEVELKQLESSFDDLKSRTPISEKLIASWLKKDEAVIEFIRFRYYNHGWTDKIKYAALVVLKGDRKAKFVPLFEEKQFLNYLSTRGADPVNLYSSRGIVGVTDSTIVPSDSLYYFIWRPLEKSLSGIKTVYYSPAGLLHRIAFQALRPDSIHYLIDGYHLNEVMSSRVLLSKSENFKPHAVSLWGDIDYSYDTLASKSRQLTEEKDDDNDYEFGTLSKDRGAATGDWQPLQETKEEIDSIGKLLTASGIDYHSVTGSAATEEAFKALDGKSPQVIHLATHGFFLPRSNKFKQGQNGINRFSMQKDPMIRSGLVLAGANGFWSGKQVHEGKEDGILIAKEIQELDLSKTDLVVLSACETALGDLQGNEGVIGLQRAFKIAGVKQMIISLWRVPDKETMELMTLFYKNWISGQSTREALRSAQFTMRAKENSEPYNWAAFVLVE